MAKTKVEKEDSISEIESLHKEIEKLGGRVSQSIGDLAPSYFLNTRIFSLDKALSEKGGIPGNAVIELFGPAGIGKSSLSLHISAMAQKQDIKVFYINAERSINESITKCFTDLDVSKISWITPETGENAINIMTHILETQQKCLIINDSIPACVPSITLEASAEESQVGALARLFSPFMPKAKKFCSLNNNILIQLNQERAKIGPMARGSSQPGGYALKFYCDIRIKIDKKYPSPEIKSGEDTIGHYIKAEIVKNRCGVPYKEAIIPLIYGKGIDLEREMVEYAIMFSIIKKSGAWFVLYDEDKEINKSQGIEKMANFIREDRKARNLVESKLKEIMS